MTISGGGFTRVRPNDFAGFDATGDGNPATDTTGDGLLNDVSGDGAFDIFDVQALFDRLP